MPDLQNFSITRNGTVSLPNAPTWLISGQVCASGTPDVIRDFTGANAVSFPQVLGNLTAQQQDDFVAESVLSLLRKRGIV